MPNPTLEQPAKRRKVVIEGAHDGVYGVSDTKVELVLDAKILAPQATHAEIAAATGFSKGLVDKVLASDYAKRKLHNLVNYRQVMARKLPENVMLAVDYQNKALRKGTKALDSDNPNAVLAHEAGKAASDTLRGTGVFQEHIKQANTIEATSLQSLLDRQERLILALEAASASTPLPAPGPVGEGQVVDAEGGEEA